MLVHTDPSHTRKALLATDNIVQTIPQRDRPQAIVLDDSGHVFLAMLTA